MGFSCNFCRLAVVLYTRFTVWVPAVTLKRDDKLQEYDKIVINKTRGYTGRSRD